MKETKKSQSQQNYQNTHTTENLHNSQNPQNSLNPQKISTNPSIEKRKETDNQRNEEILENELNQPETNKEILRSNNYGNLEFDNQEKKDILKTNQDIKYINLPYGNGSIIDNKLKNNDNEEYIPSSIGKLIFDPLSLFVYDSKKNSFHVQKFDLTLNNFEELNNSSSCCNGDNKLFVSGGNTNTGEIINKLWIFDLDDYNIEEPIEIDGKTNHSMIYILHKSKKYIFFVGGNTENVFYFDIETKTINSWGKLNMKRIDPALIKVNNYLYAFDNIKTFEDIDNFEISFERTSFFVSSMPCWELIKPNLSPQIMNTKFIPKFFGVAKESDDNIIFLGGNSLNDNEDIEQNKNYKYNIENNLIELSDVPFVSIVLKEKTFFNFNDKKDVLYILPDFYKKCPQVVFYVKKKNLVKVIDYKPKLRNETDKNNNVENPEVNRINSVFKNYDFNMPKKPETFENEIIEI